MTIGFWAEELRLADRIVGDILSDLLLAKAADPVEGFREKYRAALSRVLREQLDRFEDEGVQQDINEMMAYAETAFGPEIAERLRPETERYLERAFRTGQKLRAVPTAAAALWNRPRQEATAWLVDNDAFWLGKVFPEQVRETFRDGIVAGLEEGLGRKDIARRVRDLLTGTKDVPGKIELYDRVVSSSISRARNWGGAFTLEEAGIETYTWRAVGDDRSCVRCMSFDGQTFSTAPAMETVREALGSKPSAIERLSPWPTEDTERGGFYIETGGRRQYVQDKDPEWLQDHGMGLPPLHGGCRCVILAGRP